MDGERTLIQRFWLKEDERHQTDKREREESTNLWLSYLTTGHGGPNNTRAPIHPEELWTQSFTKGHLANRPFRPLEYGGSAAGSAACVDQLSLQAWLLGAEAGMESLFWGRMDYQVFFKC